LGGVKENKAIRFAYYFVVFLGLIEQGIGSAAFGPANSLNLLESNPANPPFESYPL